MLSIILPAYNEEQMIPITVRTLAETMGTEIPYELLFIDDGSRDKTWDVICAQAQEDPHILGIHFSRNFGKEAAMFAGLAKATGDCCVVMDCGTRRKRLWRCITSGSRGTRSSRASRRRRRDGYVPLL